MTKSKGVRLDSDLGKAANEYSNKCGPTKSYTAAFGDGALHLLDVAMAWEPNKVMSRYEILKFLKSYCGRE